VTTNAIDFLPFGLLILAAIVQVGAVLVMLRTAWDKKPLPRKSFRNALAIGDSHRRDLVCCSWCANRDNRFQRPAARSSGVFLSE
jgi:hypothetical protein